ncbi:basic membrane protein A [Candidatus Methanophagaceae archaeon]|nr:basic membrane protein A [Methanophagales archaeon]
MVFNIIKEAVEGDFKGGICSLGLKEKGVGLSIDNALPIVNDKMKGKIAEIQAKIIPSKIEIP